MVKKTLLSLAITASVAGLAGCNISSVERHNDDVDTTPTTAGTPGNQPTQVALNFNPARQDLPLAIDFLFGFPTNDDGTPVDPTDKDGTLYFAAGKNVGLFQADGTRNPDYNPVFDALNDLDGFSTSAPIYIPFSGSLQEGPVSGNAAYLVPLSYDGGPKLGTLNEAAPFDLAKFSNTSITAEVISYADGDLTNSVLKINPTTPLANNTRYLVVLTNELKDANGNPTVVPSQYDYLAGDGDLLNPALAPAREFIQGWKQLAQGFISQVRSADPSILTAAYTFTTGGTTEVLNSMAAPGNTNAALSNKDVPAVVQNVINTAPEAAVDTVLSGAPFNLSAEQIGGAKLLATLPSPAPRKSDFSASATVATSEIIPGAASAFRTGSIELPYYLSAPAGAYAGENPLDGFACSAETAECAQNKFTAANVISEFWTSDEDVIVNIQKGSGAPDAVAEATRAPSENVTNLFPFAEEQGKVSVPVMVVEPVAGAPYNCTKPAAGWPVVIYQHGITSNRIATLPLADQFAKACYATVAIDLPMHGPTPNLTFEKTVAPNTTADVPVLAAVNASANSTQPLNVFLAAPAETQAQIVAGQTITQRHFGLTVAADGVSPTAMTQENAQSGSLYINLIRFQTSRDNNRQAVMDLLNLNASIPFMDIDNDGNGMGLAPDFDKDNIYFAGISLGGIIGSQFVAVNNGNVLAANPDGNSALNPIKAAALGNAGGGIAKLLENSGTFGPQIVGGLTNPNGFNLTQGGDSYESLLYTVQSMVDSADPINFAAQLKATGTPYTFIESIGDNVVPNNVAAAPLAGTDPLVAQLGSTQVDGSTDFSAITPVQVLVKLEDEFSNHTSMAVPDTDDATPETPATFGLLASHIISLFQNPAAPTLTDGGANIIAPVAE